MLVEGAEGDAVDLRRVRRRADHARLPVRLPLVPAAAPMADRKAVMGVMMIDSKAMIKLIRPGPASGPPAAAAQHR